MCYQVLNLEHGKASKIFLQDGATQMLECTKKMSITVFSWNVFNRYLLDDAILVVQSLDDVIMNKLA